MKRRPLGSCTRSPRTASDRDLEASGRPNSDCTWGSRRNRVSSLSPLCADRETWPAHPPLPRRVVLLQVHCKSRALPYLHGVTREPRENAMAGSSPGKPGHDPTSDARDEVGKICRTLRLGRPCGSRRVASSCCGVASSICLASSALPHPWACIWSSMAHVLLRSRVRSVLESAGARPMTPMSTRWAKTGDSATTKPFCGSQYYREDVSLYGAALTRRNRR